MTKSPTSFQMLVPTTSVNNDAKSLRITEIFYSLQGEANSAGWPTVFIRLTGCPLRCSYCDTTYSFTGGHRIDINDILQQVSKFDAKHICVTGGEPLAQRQCVNLLKKLCDLGYQVSLETSGAIDISPVDERVSIVMDLKTPSSNEQDKNLWSNLDLVRANDQIKFVIANRQDYQWACSVTQQYNLANKVSTVWFSPMFDPALDNVSQQLSDFPQQLANWILQDQLNVRFQIQLHKLLWQDARGK